MPSGTSKENRSEFSDDERKHLEFIQAVIARLAGASAMIKGWSLTIAVAAFGFSASREEPVVAILGLVAVTAFAILDAYYLREERLFRQLFDGVRNDSVVGAYSMNKNQFRSNRKTVVDFIVKGGVMRSAAIAGYYAPWLALGVFAFIWAVRH
jgi:hypothetical protein